MSSKFSLLVCSKLLFLSVLLIQSNLFGQAGPATDISADMSLFDLDEFVSANDSAVQLVEDIYELDAACSLRVRGDEVGNEISVYWDDKLIKKFGVRSETVLDIELPGPAVIGSFLTVHDSNDKLVFSSPVLYLTYHRGNVVETGNYGDNDPDMVDVMFLFSHVAGGGPAPPVFEHGDVDFNGAIDFDDIMVLLDHVNGGSLYPEPRADVLFDGTILVMNDEVGEDTPGPVFKATVQAAGKSTPPRPGQGARPVCLDGNPATKEWFWPDCTVCLPGGKKIGYFSFGPRDPTQRPTGSNSCFARFLVCPDGTVKLVGKCVFGDGLNSVDIGGGMIKHTCKNRFDEEDFMGHTFKECGTVMFKTNIATCEQTICLDTDGDGTMDHEIEVELTLE